MFSPALARIQMGVLYVTIICDIFKCSDVHYTCHYSNEWQMQPVVYRLKSVGAQKLDLLHPWQNNLGPLLVLQCIFLMCQDTQFGSNKTLLNFISHGFNLFWHGFNKSHILGLQPILQTTTFCSALTAEHYTIQQFILLLYLLHFTQTRFIQKPQNVHGTSQDFFKNNTKLICKPFSSCYFILRY